ncbi:hypothetical protein ABG067_007855, partial [Albugo candida]
LFTTLESVTATAFINDLDETPDQTEDPGENLPEQRDEVLELNTSISDDIDVEYDEVVVTDDIDVDKDDAVTDDDDNDYEDVEDLDDTEEVELDENQFNEIDEELGSIKEKSVVDKYLESIQNRLRGKGMPVEYKNGTFWVSVNVKTLLTDLIRA